MREEAKAPQVNTRGPELSTDGPDHTTRLKRHHSGQGGLESRVEFQADNAQLVTQVWLHRCQCVSHGSVYKAVNPPLRN